MVQLTSTKTGEPDGEARLPVAKFPVFSIEAQSEVISVYTPTGGRIARWETHLSGNTNSSTEFNLVGTPVIMTVTPGTVGTLATRVTFRSGDKEASLDIPAGEPIHSWGRVKPEGNITFSSLPDYD